MAGGSKNNTGKGEASVRVLKGRMEQRVRDHGEGEGQNCSTCFTGLQAQLMVCTKVLKHTGAAPKPQRVFTLEFKPWQLG